MARRQHDARLHINADEHALAPDVMRDNAQAHQRYDTEVRQANDAHAIRRLLTSKHIPQTRQKQPRNVNEPLAATCVTAHENRFLYQRHRTA